METEEPRAGFYKKRVVKDGVYVGIRIWFGQPLDPDTGEVMDRSLRWQATLDGQLVDLESVWPWCGRDPIGRSEYERLLQLRQRSAPDDQSDPFANPRQPINLLTAPLPQFD